MPDFTAVDPDVLDDVAAYGSEPVEDGDARAERLSRAFEGGATLRLDPPLVSDDPTEPVSFESEDGTPRRRRRRRLSGEPRMTRSRAVGGAQLGTLFVAGFSMLIGFAVGEWAAPSDDEGKAIAVPLGNILARRIDIASKLGKDTEDVINLTIALMAYMARVGPIAAGRAREGWNERTRQRNAARVDRPPQPVGASDRGGTGRMAPGPHGTPSTPLGAARSPLDAVAAVASNGLSILDRDLGGATRQPPAVAG